MVIDGFGHDGSDLLFQLLRNLQKILITNKRSWVSVTPWALRMPQVMVHVDHDGYDYMVEDYEDQIDVGEEAEEILQARERVSLESESDEDEHEVTNVSDTTAAEARRGKDIQGIPWTMLQFTRDKYREQRLLQYKNYENLNRSHEELDKECKSFTKGGKFYEFRHNTRSVKSTYVHFQLRNLVWATSKHDVYLMHSYSVMHWSPLTRKSTEVLNVSGPVVSVTEAKRNPWAHHHHGLGPVQISTMCVKNNLLVAGGFQGEMVCKNLNRPGVAYCAKITHDENAITNAIEIYDDASGGTRLMSSNNDSVVRVFDCEVFSVLSKFEYKWPVNVSTVPFHEKVKQVEDHHLRRHGLKIELALPLCPTHSSSTIVKFLDHRQFYPQTVKERKRERKTPRSYSGIGHKLQCCKREKPHCKSGFGIVYVPVVSPSLFSGYGVDFQMSGCGFSQLCCSLCGRKHPC